MEETKNLRDIIDKRIGKLGDSKPTCAAEFDRLKIETKELNTWMNEVVQLECTLNLYNKEKSEHEFTLKFDEIERKFNDLQLAFQSRCNDIQLGLDGMTIKLRRIQADMVEVDEIETKFKDTLEDFRLLGQEDIQIAFNKMNEKFGNINAEIVGLAQRFADLEKRLK